MLSAQPFETVCWWDPAVDINSPATNLEQYIRTRDLKFLAMRPGGRPMTFVLRPISRRVAITFLRRGATDDEQRMLAFQASVIEVRNARLEDGRDEPRWFPRRCTDVMQTQQDQIAELVSYDELEYFDATAILDVGEVARVRAFLPRGTVPLYRPPPTSVQLATTAPSLFAAEAKSTEPEAPNSSPAEASAPSTSA